MGLSLEPAPWKNNFEEYYADESLGGREARYRGFGPET
jgi:hypothetical protein